VLETLLLQWEDFIRTKKDTDTSAFIIFCAHSIANFSSKNLSERNSQGAIRSSCTYCFLLFLLNTRMYYVWYYEGNLSQISWEYTEPRSKLPKLQAESFSQLEEILQILKKSFQLIAAVTIHG